MSIIFLLELILHPLNLFCTLTYEGQLFAAIFIIPCTRVPVALVLAVAMDCQTVLIVSCIVRFTFRGNLTIHISQGCTFKEYYTNGKSMKVISAGHMRIKFLRIAFLRICPNWGIIVLTKKIPGVEKLQCENVILIWYCHSVRERLLNVQVPITSNPVK